MKELLIVAMALVAGDAERIGLMKQEPIDETAAALATQMQRLNTPCGGIAEQMVRLNAGSFYGASPAAVDAATQARRDALKAMPAHELQSLAGNHGLTIPGPATLSPAQGQNLTAGELAFVNGVNPAA